MKTNSYPEPLLWHFFDPATSTFTHIVACPRSRRAAIIDSVHDFDAKSARFSTVSADRLIATVRDEKLVLDWILETHAHADHISAAPRLKTELGGKIGIGLGIRDVQKTFARVFDLGLEFATDGSQFDHLFAEGDRFNVGELELEVLATPGHTPDSITYLVGSHAFVGDTLFPPDYGTARCDFPGGDARALYKTIQQLHSLPAETLLHFCHDYPAAGDRTHRACQCRDFPHQEHSLQDRHDARRVCRNANGAGPDARYPTIADPRRANQYCRRASAATRGERYRLSEDPCRRYWPTTGVVGCRAIDTATSAHASISMEPPTGASAITARGPPAIRR